MMMKMVAMMLIKMVMMLMMVKMVMMPLMGWAGASTKGLCAGMEPQRNDDVLGWSLIEITMCWDGASTK